MQIYIRTVTGRTIILQVSPNESVYTVKKKIQDKMGLPCAEQPRLIFDRKPLEDDNTLADCNIQNESIIYLVPRLRGKPVILFYPPTSGEFASVRSFHTKTTVALNSSCSFTTLLPRPTIDESGKTITWDGIVSKSCAGCGESEEPAKITVNGRDHAYLFWEAVSDCGTGPDAEADSQLVGYKSVVNHAENAYILNGMKEYEEWCVVMLTAIGLNTRERDDFMMFWAGKVYKHGPIVIARVVPESDVCKSSELHVDARTSGEESKNVTVNVRRVYVTLIVCKEIPKDLLEQREKLRKWKPGCEAIELPDELKGTYPIVRDSASMTVIEWGGVLEVA